MKFNTYRGQGKDLAFQLKCLKRLAYRFCGISFLFCPPRSRVIIYESILEFIDELTGLVNSEILAKEKEDTNGLHE